MAGLSLERVTKTFRLRRARAHAVCDFSLEIADGELMVLVGPSGCGKTTLLRLIAGLESPTDGVIRLGDRVINDVDSKDRDVALVFQHHALYPHMSVFDNMAFGLKMRGGAREDIHRQVHETAELLGIAPLLQRKPFTLSGGERQRVALGRAIARRPAVFLLDEPLSNLDASLRRCVRAEIKSLHRALRTTMILVTHDQEEAMALGDRIAVLRAGTLQQCGLPMSVHDNPVNRFVAGFIGTPPMNFIEGRVKSDGRRWFFAAPFAMLELPDSLAPAALSAHEALLAVRPQHLRIVGPQPIDLAQQDLAGEDPTESEPGAVDMEVCGVEAFGDRTDVHLQSAMGNSLIAVTTPHSATVIGDRVRVQFDLSQAHLFPVDAQH